jgi:hypothetical protein
MKIAFAFALTFAVVGCSSAARPFESDEEELGVSPAEAALANPIQLTEIAAPPGLQAALDTIPIGDQSARQFEITAPDDATAEERIQGALSRLFFRTNKAGSFSLVKFCATHTPPITTATACATAIRTAQEHPDGLREMVDAFGGDFPEEEQLIKDTVAALGEGRREFQTTVEVGHFEDGEFIRDFTAMRSVIFDETTTRVLTVRYISASSL